MYFYKLTSENEKQNNDIPLGRETYSPGGRVSISISESPLRPPWKEKCPATACPDATDTLN